MMAAASPALATTTLPAALPELGREQTHSHAAFSFCCLRGITPRPSISCSSSLAINSDGYRTAPSRTSDGNRKHEAECKIVDGTADRQASRPARNRE
jgi:hypothetical protein